MLILSRRENQKIVMPSLGIEIIVIDIRGDRVRLGLTVPKEIAVHRAEVQERIEREGLREREREA